jgi:tetratricopeptide (TPR) repeat protein
MKRLLLALAAGVLATSCATRAPLDLESRWDYYDPAESEARFRTMLAEARLSTHERLEVQTQIARALGLQGRFEEAKRALDGVAAARTRDAVVAARLHLERGRVLRSSGDAAAARPEFERALSEAERAGDEFLAVDALHMLAIIASPEDAARANLAAIARVEPSRDPRVRRWLAPLHINLGWAHFDRGELTQALAAFERAVPLYAVRGNPDDVRFARWAVARAQRSLGRCVDALPAQQALLSEHRAAGTEDGFVLEEIAECLLALGRSDEARPFFRDAARVLSRDADLVRQEPERLARLKRLGEG